MQLALNGASKSEELALSVEQKLYLKSVFLPILALPERFHFSRHYYN